MNIVETTGPIAIRVCLKQQCGWGKAALDFGADWFTTLASIATDSSHRIIMGKTVLPLFLGCFNAIFFILASNEGMY